MDNLTDSLNYIDRENRPGGGFPRRLSGESTPISSTIFMINAAALINTPRKTNSWVLTIPRWWSSGQHGGRGHRHQGSCHHYGAG